MRLGVVKLWWICAAVVVAAASAAGLYVLVRFLRSQSLDDADQWASAIGMGLAAITLVGSIVVWLARCAAKPDESHLGGGGFYGSLAVSRPQKVDQLPTVPIVIGRKAESEAAKTILAQKFRPLVINIHGLPGAGKTDAGL